MNSWEPYPRFQISLFEHEAPTHSNVQRHLAEIEAIRPSGMKREVVGQSEEGRSIQLVTIGKGPKKVLAWSQMHGDEPTHTIMLLELMNLLQQHHDDRRVKSLLENCTLYLVPMLNPDGAERWTRRNAQGIDVNRDARQLASAEGRLLKSLVEVLKPHFAFNLHNQNARTTVGRELAAVSLLVPPIDHKESETPSVRIAKQVAAVLRKHFEPHCQGMISRYDADYMSRAFGEWVQGQSVSTVLIEAGGWHTVKPLELERLHLFGFTNTLFDIASDEHLGADINDYESLERSGEHPSFDVLISDATIINGLRLYPFRANVGINLPPLTHRRDVGRIEDLGDLSVHRGQIVVTGDGLVCMPGRVAYLPEISPSNMPSEDLLREVLTLGITTIVGQVNLESQQDMECFSKLDQESSLPVNLGFVARILPVHQESPQAMADRLLFAISRGVLGLVAEQAPLELIRYAEWFGLSLLDEESLLSARVTELSLEQIPQHTGEFAARLGLADRGTIFLNGVADLLVLDDVDLAAPDFTIRWTCLRQVLVGGKVVFDRGTVTGELPGKLLISRSSKVISGCS